MRIDPERALAFFASPDYSAAPESPAKCMQWLDSGNRRFGHFIDGQFTDPGTTLFDAINPANDEVLGHFTQATQADVDAAFAAAQGAFLKWSKLSGRERARYLYAIERTILRNRRDLEVLETMNNGKPFREARLADVPLAARHFGHHAALASIFEHRFPDRVPGGVVGAVIPWNFPLLMAAWKIAQIICAGNTVVIKPGDTTPVTIMYLAELFQRVGLPTGVVNIVTGDREVGRMIVSHPTPWKIMFTGSTRAGREIRKATAGSLKKVTMELGGKSPTVVCDDADLDAAVEGVVRSILFNKGEVCCAGSRLIVHEAVALRFTEMLKWRFGRIRVDDPLDKCVDLGAMNSRAQLDKVEGLIRLAEEHGAEVWQPDCSLPSTGFFVKPTLLLNISPANPVAREEVFGPVLSIMTFRTTEEAIALANNTEYGLACSVWSRDIGKAHVIASQINGGTRWINCTQQFDAAAGFGGTRESGFGREGGFEGIYDVTLEKPITERVPAKEWDKPIGRLDRWLPTLDLTHRFLIGGALVRPDEARSFKIRSLAGELLGEVGLAGRKDVRNAVTAARGAHKKWTGAGGDLRRKVLMFMAEKLDLARLRLVQEIMLQTDCEFSTANEEINCSIDRLFYWASWAVNYGGTVQTVAQPRMQVTATNESIGVIGIRAPDALPLLGIVNAIAPALAMGNSVVVVAGKHPLTAMTLVEIIQTSDVPGGVVNILTATRPDAIAVNLANHRGVDGLWCFGEASIIAQIETASTCNMKRTWAVDGGSLDWRGPAGESLDFLRHATQVMNTWSAIGA